jgi:hypothetical protein
MPKLEATPEDEYAPRFAYVVHNGRLKAIQLSRSDQTAQAQLAWREYATSDRPTQAA